MLAPDPAAHLVLGAQLLLVQLLGQRLLHRVAAARLAPVRLRRRLQPLARLRGHTHTHVQHSACNARRGGGGQAQERQRDAAACVPCGSPLLPSGVVNAVGWSSPVS